MSTAFSSATPLKPKTRSSTRAATSATASETRAGMQSRQRVKDEDELELLEAYGKEKRGNGGELESTDGGELTLRDKRALALLVALCRSSARATRLNRNQICSRASLSDSHLGPSPSFCAPSFPTPRSASLPCARIPTRSNYSGVRLSTRSSLSNWVDARAGSSLFSSLLGLCCGGWEGT